MIAQTFDDQDSIAVPADRSLAQRTAEILKGLEKMHDSWLRIY